MDYILAHPEQIATVAGIVVAFVAGRIKGGRYKRFLLKFIRGVEAAGDDQLKKDIKSITVRLGLEHLMEPLVKRNTRYIPKPEEGKDADSDIK